MHKFSSIFIDDRDMRTVWVIDTQKSDYKELLNFFSARTKSIDIEEHKNKPV